MIARRVIAVDELAVLVDAEVQKDPEAELIDVILQCAKRACTEVVRVYPDGAATEAALAQQLRDIADSLDPPGEEQT